MNFVRLLKSSRLPRFHRLFAAPQKLLAAAAIVWVLLAPVCLLAQEANKRIQQGEVPDEIRQEILNEYFKERWLIVLLWEHYRTETVVALIGLVVIVFAVRNYARNQGRHEQRLFDTLQTNAVLVFDRASDLKMMNRAAKNALGLDEFVSMTEDYSYYLKKAPSPEILEVFEDLQHARHPVEREVVFNHNKVMRTMVVKGYPLYTESKRLDGFVLMMSDITDAIERDRRINWSGVAQHVAHKAKTPLSTITLTAQHLELLLSEHQEGRLPELNKYTGRIIGESRKLNEIVHNLTRLANKEQLNLLPNDVNTIMQNIVDEYRSKSSQNIQFITHFYRTLPKVGIDIAHFPEAMQNLLDNAVRAIGSRDGRVIITTAPGQWIDRTGDYVEVTIQDTGGGMSDEIKKSIFRPFSTHSQGGTGLGLVIVQKLIQEHNGEITFNSTLGVGTTFQIRLPIYKN